MTRTHKIANLLAVGLPFLALIVALITLWNRYVTWTDIGIMVVMYLLTATGITVGFHRLFTHRSFQAPRPVRVTFAALGSMAVEGPLAYWVADHRSHHQHSDQEGDPHSPHVGHGDGLGGALAGLWHAHTGWLFSKEGQSDARRYARDILRDRDLLRISKAFPWFVAASLAIPALAGFVLTQSLIGALTGFLWGGLVRIFFVHHVTWSINSVCHYFGRRRFATDDHSRNNIWLALPSLGEAWHHNHHAFPTSASHGLKWYEIDLSALMIRGMARIGLASDVVVISPERQASMQRKREEAQQPEQPLREAA